jgi:hypothetical protein
MLPNPGKFFESSGKQLPAHYASIAIVTRGSPTVAESAFLSRRTNLTGSLGCLLHRKSRTAGYS